MQRVATNAGSRAFVDRKPLTPPDRRPLRSLRARCAGCANGFLSTKARLPAFVATLCMFYIARGIAAYLVAGNQLNQFPESYNLLGRKLIEVLHAWGYQPMPGSFVASLAAALSTQTLILFVLALIFAVILWKSPFGYMVTATGGNRAPPAMPASTLTASVSRACCWPRCWPRSPASSMSRSIAPTIPPPARCANSTSSPRWSSAAAASSAAMARSWGAGRCLGDHADAGAVVAADLPFRRPLVRDAATLGQCLELASS